MRNIKLTIEYDGTNYHGWQIQPNVITIQEMIQSALTKLTKTQTRIIGAGRTDSGVTLPGKLRISIRILRCLWLRFGKGFTPSFRGTSWSLMSRKLVLIFMLGLEQQAESIDIPSSIGSIPRHSYGTPPIFPLAQSMSSKLIRSARCSSANGIVPHSNAQAAIASGPSVRFMSPVVGEREISSILTLKRIPFCGGWFAQLLAPS